METTITDSNVNLLHELSQFTGTEEYYEHSIGRMRLLLTDGCHFVRERFQAYWLFDVVLSHQTSKRVRDEVFQVWKLKRFRKRWIINCTDGNGKLLAKQIIEYSDFPLDEITIWIEDGVALLPSEH